jgi:hypothetical protein
VTDDDGRGEFVALRAFKSDDELWSWVAGVGEELPGIRATLESRLTPLLPNEHHQVGET